jgi:hypothetical protein
MASITVGIKNDTTSNQIVHVYDLFGGGRREVEGSPFALAPEDPASTFSVNAGDGRGQIEYRCENGPSLTGIDVSDGDVVKVD